MKRKNKILIVEDEYIIAIDLKKILVKLGYEVTSFVGKGEEALIKAEQEKPDLILMDIMLHGKLNGIQTAELIKQKFEIPVVYLTALIDEETLQKAKITEPGGYLLKPFEEKALHSAIELALYKFIVEKQLKEKTRELEEEKTNNDKLLHHILPADVIYELKMNGMVDPRHYDSISILFTDFEGFSQITNQLPPAVLVDELNEIFSAFDTIIERYELEKLKSIGDTYMICSGLFEEQDNHAVRIIFAAMEMLNYLEVKNKSSKVKWKLKAGINSGPVVAGVVGTNKFTYDVWGDAVNIASRMENSSKGGEINISGSTFALVKDSFYCEYRGKLSVKGKGETEMYFVKEAKVKNPVEILDD